MLIPILHIRYLFFCLSLSPLNAHYYMKRAFKEKYFAKWDHYSDKVQLLCTSKNDTQTFQNCISNRLSPKKRSNTLE